MKWTILSLAVALVAATSASAAGANMPWTKRDITAAVRAIGYPKQHAKTVACTGSGASMGGFASFRCVAAYKHHRRRSFYIEGQGEGGWLCAGATLAGCKLLGHGFITTSSVKVQGLGASADLAARGYMTDKFGSYQAQGFCKQTTSSTWSCPFVGETVTLRLKKATGGYVTGATASS